MTVKSAVKTRKSEENTLKIGTKKLSEHLEKYKDVDIRKLPVDDYLIHKRFVVNGNYFFIFKTVIVKLQLRLLCYIKDDTLIIIEYYIKKDPRKKYYEDFKVKARKYSSSF